MPRSTVGFPLRTARTSWRPAAIACALTALAACAGNDYLHHPPSARLELFGSRTSSLSIVVYKNETETSPVPPTQSFDPNDLTIRATGAQLDRGLGTLDLSIRATEPLKCHWVNPDGGVMEGVATGPGEVHATQTASAPIGVLMLEYDIRGYLAKIHCANAPGKFDGEIVLVLTVTNVAGVKTETPRVSVRPS
jgi:hypothetical protein